MAEKPLLSVETGVFFALLCLCFFLFSCFSSCLQIPRSRYEKRGELLIEDGSARDAQTRWIKLDIAISVSVNEGYILYHVDQLFA